MIAHDSTLKNQANHSPFPGQKVDLRRLWRYLIAAVLFMSLFLLFLYWRGNQARLLREHALLDFQATGGSVHLEARYPFWIRAFNLQSSFDKNNYKKLTCIKYTSDEALSELAFSHDYSYVNTLTACTDQCTVQGLLPFDRFPQLDHLMLRGDLNDSQFLEQLKSKDSISTIGCFQSNLFPDFFACLKNLPNLDNLHLIETNFTDEDWQHLPEIKNLRCLRIHDSRITEAGLSWLSQCPNLDALHLNRVKFNETSSSALQAITGLTYLTLEDSEITDEGLKMLLEQNQLITLWLSGSHITDSGLKYLASEKQLKHLNLQGAAISEAGFSDLKKSTKLHTLIVGGNQFGDSELKVVCQMKSLFSLSIKDSQITANGLAHLATLPNLEQVIIQDNPVTQKMIDQLHQYSRLNSLKLTNTELTDSHLKSLRRFTFLDYLDVSENNLSSEAIESFIRSNPGCKLVSTSTPWRFD